MQTMPLRRRRFFYFWSLTFWLWFTALPILPDVGSAQAQTLTLAQLPYQDPRPLNSLLALDEPHFAATITNSWSQVERTLARYISASVSIDQPSFFFSSNRTLCTRTHQPNACRVYLDFLAFLMRSKQPAHASTTPLPIVMRPTQLPWRDTAVLNALLAQDKEQLQSALTDHWRWVHQVTTRYLPDHVDLHPVSKIFINVRDVCNSAHTEAPCREHLLELGSLVDSNRHEARTVFLSLNQLVYRDPTPLDNLLRLNESQLRLRLANSWPQIDTLLNQYIARNVALTGTVDFSRSRLDCQAWMPGDYFLCRMYIKNLATLMRDKQAAQNNPHANPFGQRSR
jgi:hypothetical protein